MGCDLRNQRLEVARKNTRVSEHRPACGCGGGHKKVGRRIRPTLSRGLFALFGFQFREPFEDERVEATQQKGPPEQWRANNWVQGLNLKQRPPGCLTKDIGVNMSNDALMSLRRVRPLRWLPVLLPV